MEPEPAGRSNGEVDRLVWLLAVLVVTGTLAVLLALFVTHGWADFLMVLLAMAALVAAYAVRREARRQLIYPHGADNTMEEG
jgi:protein-S-isoprenylcysteine O-methyltransferase Ste14